MNKSFILFFTAFSLCTFICCGGKKYRLEDFRKQDAHFVEVRDKIFKQSNEATALLENQFKNETVQLKESLNFQLGNFSPTLFPVSFSEGEQRKIVLPLFSRLGQLFTKVKLGESAMDLTLMIHTGSSYSTLTPEAIRRITNDPRARKYMNGTVTEAETQAIFTGCTKLTFTDLSWGPILLTGKFIKTESNIARLAEKFDFRVDGTLAADNLCRYPFELDYVNCTLTFFYDLDPQALEKSGYQRQTIGHLGFTPTIKYRNDQCFIFNTGQMGYLKMKSNQTLFEEFEIWNHSFKQIPCYKLASNEFPQLATGILRNFKLLFDQVNETLWIKHQPFYLKKDKGTYHPEKYNSLSAMERARDAVIYFELDCLKTIVENEMETIDEKSIYEQTLLHVAINLGNLNAVKYLAEKFPHLEHQNDDGETALMRAISFANLEIADVLIAHGAKKGDNTTLKKCAQESGDPAALKWVEELFSSEKK